MTTDKIIAAFTNIVLAITIALLLLLCTPLANNPLAKGPYYLIVTVFWLFLLLRILLGQWQKNRAITYKSYIGQDNRVKKRLLMPSGKELIKAASGLLQLNYLVSLFLLALLFYLNHLLLFAPYYATELLPRFFAGQWAGRFSQVNILLTAGVASLLLLAGTVLDQTQEIKKNNRIYNIQNLIIHAHSHVSLDKLSIHFIDGEKMFATMNKTEYILQAKPLPTIHLPHGQALLQISLSVKLAGDIPLTEFYIKGLSLFVGDLVIECENFHHKFYSLFAVNNDSLLNFYINCKDVASLKLSENFLEAGDIRLYYNFVLKNSVGVITEFYGTALYEKEPASLGIFSYVPHESKNNQYYYM